MPLDFRISHAEQMVHAVAVGEISADEIQAFLGSVIAEHAMPYSKIFDFSQVTALRDAVRLGEVGDTIRLYDKMKPSEIGDSEALLFLHGPQQHTLRPFLDNELGSGRQWRLSRISLGSTICPLVDTVVRFIIKSYR